MSRCAGNSVVRESLEKRRSIIIGAPPEATTASPARAEPSVVSTVSPQSEYTGVRPRFGKMANSLVGIVERTIGSFARGSLLPPPSTQQATQQEGCQPRVDK